MPYYNKDPKRDPNFDNHPYRNPIAVFRVSDLGSRFRVQGLGLRGRMSGFGVQATYFWDGRSLYGRFRFKNVGLRV